MQQHLAADLVEQYVIGALDPASARFVEDHVAACAPCAALLQREAQLEVALLETAQHRIVSLSARRRRRVVAAVASAAAVLAAGVALVFSLSSPSPSKPPRLRECVDAATAAQCISEAQFDGVITIGPDRELIIPRYDVTSGGQP